MEKIISEKFDCKIIERDEKLFIRFDEGHFVVKFVEYEINQEEAEKAMESEKGAYQVILAAQSRKSRI